jgi:hypothetical protein
MTGAAAFYDDLADRYHLIFGAWETHHHETRYRAVLRAELAEILHEAGFRDVTWQTPETSGYYQPVVKARGG